MIHAPRCDTLPHRAFPLVSHVSQNAGCDAFDIYTGVKSYIQFAIYAIPHAHDSYLANKNFWHTVLFFIAQLTLDRSQ